MVNTNGLEKQFLILGQGLFTDNEQIHSKATSKEKGFYFTIRNVLNWRKRESYHRVNIKAKSPNISITRQELEWLAERVEMLHELTKKICKKKIESFTQSAVLKSCNLQLAARDRLTFVPAEPAIDGA